jgi:hypothetical protein
MQLPEDFKEFIGLMISERVRFVMIGGYAYNLYRNPRATGDIDFFVACDRENDSRVRRVLDRFGFAETLPPPTDSLLKPGKVVMLGRSPFRIDLITEIDGVNFTEVEKTCRQFNIDQLAVPVISAEMLLKNKESTGRAKDASDAEELRQLLKS